GRRLERLTEEQQRLLEVASVGGTAFSAAAVAAGMEATVEQVDEWCEELVKRGQFLQTQEPTMLPDGAIFWNYQFLHALYQAVLYERVLPMRRLRLHRRIGEHQERRYGEYGKDIAAELAVHFERGQQAQKAVQYYHQASENALRRYAYREAIE